VARQHRNVRGKRGQRAGLLVGLPACVMRGECLEHAARGGHLGVEIGQGERQALGGDGHGGRGGWAPIVGQLLEKIKYELEKHNTRVYRGSVRSYRQYCGLARALDLVGDRWVLLIVRELLIRGSARYSDLLAGLPGIATNLLGDRLTDLEERGLVVREELPPPTAATVFRLTDRGRELEDVIAAFGRWARPLMSDRKRGDAVRGHWYVLPARLYLRDRSPDAARVNLQLELDGDPVILSTVGDGSVTANPGRVSAADATLAGEPQVVMGVLAGRLTLKQGRTRGLHFSGQTAALERIRANGAMKASKRR
jgi:DNA-binding HxlR family transcriptional regulator